MYVEKCMVYVFFPENEQNNVRNVLIDRVPRKREISEYFRSTSRVFLRGKEAGPRVR